jgi:type VI secretion system protein ImpJ
MSRPHATSVLWREGMFLCPQHLQAFGRELSARIATGDAAGRPGPYGLITLEIDQDALERDTFRVTEFAALFRDGTLLAVPQTGDVPQREFGEHFSSPELTVYLGIAAVGENVPQIGEERERAYRYRVELNQVYDENIRDATRELEFRSLRGHLFFGDEDRSGYECLPIARLVRAGKPATVSALSPDYVPPVLRCGAVSALTRALGEIAERARAQARDLAATLPDTTRLSSIDSAADLSGMMKLQAVNGSVTVLEQLSRAADLHPHAAYIELVRTVGELSIFSDERVPPELPAYDHGQLNDCLRTVLDSIRTLLGAQVAVPYDTVAFEADAGQEGVFYAPVPADWLGANPVFYLGVELAQPQVEVAELVAAGVKLLAPDDLEHVVQGVLPGIELAPLRIPPTSFPKRSDLHFFRIGTEGASRDLWLNVVRAQRAMVLSALGHIGDVGYGLYVELRS